MEGRDSWVFGMDRDTLLYLKMENLGGPTLEQRNSARAYVAAWMGGKSGGVISTYIFMQESLCCSPKTNNIVNRLYWNTKKKFFFGTNTF